MRVLLVDDDVELVELLRDYLEREGFTVAAAHDGVAGVAAALSGAHDIVVLDVMMPGMNGIQALAQIRAASAVPVVMLTARGTTPTASAGWNWGRTTTCPSPAPPGS